MDIRYHHLLCLPRFEGKGYSADFCKNMANVKKRYNNEKITLVEHCDEICSHCPNNKGGKCKEEEKVKSYDKTVKKLISLVLRSLSTRRKLRKNMVKQQIQGYLFNKSTKYGERRCA